VATKLGQGIQFQPFQLSYAESGLFGVRISAPNNGAKLEEAVSAAVVQVRKLAESGLQDADHKRAVSQAKSTLAMASETTEGQLALLSSMVFQSGPASMTTQELVATYDQVSAQDIKAAAQALVKATPSSVGIGNRFAIPRLAQL
ncbi:ubiquinol-cytochrome c reductase core subunit 1, partial [Dimargaris verticillata]